MACSGYTNAFGWPPPDRAVRLGFRMGRRPLIAAVAAALAIGGIATACGYEGQTTATPETVQGSVPQTTTETTTTETTPAPAGDAAAGKVVFTANCGGCHTLADAGTSGTVGPNLDDAKPPASLVVDRVTNGRGVMPPFGGQLSAKQIADVAAYVSSAAGS
jgi:mono/diheme cytochrome c family protein